MGKNRQTQEHMDNVIKEMETLKKNQKCYK